MLRIAGVLVLGLCGSVSLLQAQPPPLRDEQTIQCRHGCVVSVNGLASQVGLAVLKQDGNAVDSAVATAFALAVTHPAAGNIGGGGYMLILRETGDAEVIDFRETAPASATRDMFVAPSHRTPHRRVGVPGTVRGLALAHLRHGRLPWRDLLKPAIELARDGFALDDATATSLNRLLATSEKSTFAELHRVFGQPRGVPWRAADRLVQPELAATLQLLAREGPDGFYLGVVADQIVAEMARGRGLLKHDDLARYQPIIRRPLRGSYRGFEVLSVPPSSSGGTTLIEMLNILEAFEMESERYSPANVHRTVEAMKRAYRDRARYLGDPKATDIPPKLLTKEYARERAREIDPDRATASRNLAGDLPLKGESEQTTHFSVVDAERNAVSLTYTLENSYGSRVVVAGAGFLLNDEMNDFNWLPGVTDPSGRIGGDANLVRPGMRMLSSMCPTIVMKDGKAVLVTGSPGGRTIINTVLCIVMNVIDFKMNLRDAVDAPRFHHGWFPDAIRMEPSLHRRHGDLKSALEARGHDLLPPASQGDAHSIYIDPETNELTGAADRRIAGKAAGY